MHDDELTTRLLRELAEEMPTINLANYSAEDLIKAARQAVKSRRDEQVIVGQIAAALNLGLIPDAPRMSWWTLADKFEMPSHMTVRRWAKPFIRRPDEA